MYLCWINVWIQSKNAQFIVFLSIKKGELGLTNLSRTSFSELFDKLIS